MGANSLLYEMTPNYMGGNYENDRVAVNLYLRDVIYYTNCYYLHLLYYDIMEIIGTTSVFSMHVSH